MKNTEIERKWLIDAFPDLPHEESYVMEQGYLCFGPNAVRIRKKQRAQGTQFVLTIKGGGTLTRTEVETALSESQYEALRPLVLGSVAVKQFRTYRLPGGELLECSLVDEGEPTSFMYAEVEFETEQAAAAFAAPPYLGRDVTEEPGQTMAEYCRRKAGLA